MPPTAWRSTVNYFYNRYKDLIVILGGALARLSEFRSDNLKNARAQGLEFSARLRPSRQITFEAATRT